MKELHSVDATDMEELRDLAPVWVKVIRESAPHPEDDRRTIFRYTIIDEAAEKYYIFQHNCHTEIYRVVAGTVAAMKEFGFNITQIPTHLSIELEKIQSEIGEWNYLVRLMDTVNHRCLHHYESEGILETFQGFWENIDPSVFVEASAAPAYSAES
jgi:hypothetical protein